MKLTKEMAKKIAETINQDKLLIATIKDVSKACDRFNIESVDMSYCEDGYDFERRVNEKFEEFVRESCIEDGGAVLNYFYSILEKLYPEEFKSIDLNWDEINLIVKEIKFKDKEGKIYNFEDFEDLIFELGEKGIKYIDEHEIYRIWDDCDRESKYYQSHIYDLND